jgi:hypothetical protein
MDMREIMSQMQTGMPSGPAPVPHDAALSVADSAIAKAKAPKKKHKNPIAALAKAHKAAKAGQHAQAKTHALAAVNLLHKMARPAAPAAPAVPTLP